MRKKSINALNILLVVVLAGTLFSCEKSTKEPPSTRQTIVKILGGGTPAVLKKNPVDFLPVPVKFLAIDLRRDPNDEAGLFTSMNVIIKDDTAAVRAANPNYINLPAAWYTIQSEAPKVGGMGGTFSFVFKPSEFAKQIYITIPNPTLLNPSALYGIGFTITSVDAGGVISFEKSVVYEIGAKNDLDGVYAVRGPMVDVLFSNFIQWANQLGYTDPFLVANPGSWEAHLVTISATECVVVDNTIWGNPAHPFYNTTPPGSNSGYGGFGLIVTFDPATKAISNIRNYYGDPTQPANTFGNPATGSGPPLYQASNTRYTTLDPSGANAVQAPIAPLTQGDIKIKYFMYHPSAVAGVRTTFNETWQYRGSR